MLTAHDYLMLAEWTLVGFAITLAVIFGGR